MGLTGNSVEDVWMVLWMYAGAGTKGLGMKGIDQINHWLLSDEMPIPAPVSVQRVCSACGSYECPHGVMTMRDYQRMWHTVIESDMD